MTLCDIVREVGGWPINLEAVARILQNADTVLASEGGRKCERPLLDSEVVAICTPPRRRGRPAKK